MSVRLSFIMFLKYVNKVVLKVDCICYLTRID